MSTTIVPINAREARAASKQVEMPFIDELAEAQRDLKLVYSEIEFVIRAAPLGWRSPFAEVLVCLDCGYDVDILAPNAAHNIPFGRCECSASFLEPATTEDAGLLELRYPVSEADQALGERFRDQLTRLFETKN